MNVELLKQILIVAVASSVISTAAIQKIKEDVKNKKALPFISFFTSVLLGMAFATRFTELDIFSCVWVGVITWVGADAIYKAFEDKIFKSFENIDNVIEIKRDDENE